MKKCRGSGHREGVYASGTVTGSHVEGGLRRSKTTEMSRESSALRKQKTDTSSSEQIPEIPAGSDGPFTSNLQVTHHGCLGMTMSGEQHGAVHKAAGSGTRQLSQNLICHLVLVGCQ